MVARFAREIWERFQTAGRRPRRRGSTPRPRRGRRLIESLEPRLLLSADVGSYRPVAVGPVATAATPAASRAATLWAWDDAGNSIGSSNHPGFTDARPASIGPAPPQAAGVVLPLPPEDGPPTPDELAGLPMAPWSPGYSYTGATDDSGSTAIRIPVGPQTRALTLGLRPEHDGDDAPRIDKVLLLDRGGGLLSRIGGASVLGADGEQVFHVAVRGAPVGGEIVVFLAPSSSETTLPSTGPNGDASLGNGDLAAGAAPAQGGSYFQLSIQRDDDGDLDGGAAESAAVVGGTPYIAPLERADASTSFDRSQPTSDATSPPPSIGPSPRGPVVTIAARRPDLRIDAIDYGPEEVFLGPLVSRAAAALGPVLATDVDEPTPAIGRGARSTLVDRTLLGDDLDLDALLAAAGRGEDGPALSVRRGPGGAPILVAGLRPGGDSTEVDDDLAASVLGVAQEAPLPVDSPTADPGRDDVARAGLATRALGFLVGMCLASGPLYPDLAALARRKLRRVRRRAAAGRSTAGRFNSGRA